MYKYFAYGLCVESFMELPEYIPAGADALPDVRISQDRVQGRDWGDRREYHAQWGADEFLFYWSWIGTFLVRGGCEIIIDPAPEADETMLKVALPGIIFGAVLHQRGLRVLHASSVVVNGAAVAFVGHKYAGKSTMSGALHARGHRLLSDDTVAIEFSEEGVPMVRAGIPRLHLWPDAVESLTGDISSAPELFNGGVKRGLHVNGNFVPETSPLRAIYLLQIGDEICIEPVAGCDALIALLPHTWAHRFLQEDNHAYGHILSIFGAVARSVSVRRLIRPRSLEALPEVARAVEADVEFLKTGSSQAERTVQTT